MMSKKIDVGGSRDFISGLPEALIGHILSFLPTKEAASTSVLARNWRYLFAFVYNLDFNDSVYMNPWKEQSKKPLMFHRRMSRVSTSFIDFVDRVLALQGNSPVQKFSLDIEDGLDPVRMVSWILNALERGVLYLDIRMDFECKFPLPLKIFLCETLVTIKLRVGSTIDVKNVHLPKLKTLDIEYVEFAKEGIGLSKLLAGCHVLEELVLNDICWYSWKFSSVSVTTFKKFKFHCEERDENPNRVSFDTPNLVYLEYFDTIARKYPKVNFNSLVEAHLGLGMTEDQVEEAHFEEEENIIVGDATDFIMGICNVKILYLSADTLEVLTYNCQAIPLFQNLTHLTIENSWKVGWQSVPGLLKNSPNLETLILLGLDHKTTDGCGDVCLCKPYEDEDEDEEEAEKKEVEIYTCLSSSPVKVLKILKFSETYDDEIEKKIEQVKHFLKMMPNLEQLILDYDTKFDEDVIEVSSRLQGIPRVASSKCNVQVISNHLSLSSTAIFRNDEMG